MVRKKRRSKVNKKILFSVIGIILAIALLFYLGVLQTQFGSVTYYNELRLVNEDLVYVNAFDKGSGSQVFLGNTNIYFDSNNDVFNFNGVGEQDRKNYDAIKFYLLSNDVDISKIIFGNNPYSRPIKSVPQSELDKVIALGFKGNEEVSYEVGVINSQMNDLAKRLSCNIKGTLKDNTPFSLVGDVDWEGNTNGFNCKVEDEIINSEIRTSTVTFTLTSFIPEITQEALELFEDTPLESSEEITSSPDSKLSDLSSPAGFSAPAGPTSFSIMMTWAIIIIILVLIIFIITKFIKRRR